VCGVVVVVVEQVALPADPLPFAPVGLRPIRYLAAAAARVLLEVDHDASPGFGPLRRRPRTLPIGGGPLRSFRTVSW
jgi:hypothetical protein